MIWSTTNHVIKTPTSPWKLQLHGSEMISDKKAELSSSARKNIGHSKELRMVWMIFSWFGGPILVTHHVFLTPNNIEICGAQLVWMFHPYPVVGSLRHSGSIEARLAQLIVSSPCGTKCVEWQSFKAINRIQLIATPKDIEKSLINIAVYCPCPYFLSSYHIISYHIISYHIMYIYIYTIYICILYYIILYYIISYYIILYYFILFSYMYIYIYIYYVHIHMICVYVPKLFRCRSSTLHGL